jgi:hypothetical protein
MPDDDAGQHQTDQALALNLARQLAWSGLEERDLPGEVPAMAPGPK